MPKLNWTVGLKPFIGPVVDYTSSVLSINYLKGRRSFLDQYTGNTIAVTFKNQNNVAANFTFGSVLDVNNDQQFYVVGVSFDDYPGNTGVSTCTVYASDYLQASGRNNAVNVSLGANDALTQLASLWSGRTSSNLVYSVGASSAKAYTFTGTILSRLQQTQVCEQATVWMYDNSVEMAGRNQNRGAGSRITFTRATSTGTNISYQDIKRQRADLNMANVVEVNSPTDADVIGTDTSSTALYGTVFDSVSSVDSTFNANLAQWLADVRSDPSQQVFEIEMVDTAQTADALVQFELLYYDCSYRRVHNLVWRVPGAGSDTTTTVFLEGIQINVTPQQTRAILYFSPLDYYNCFLLDDSTFGILDSSRLGW